MHWQLRDGRLQNLNTDLTLIESLAIIRYVDVSPFSIQRKLFRDPMSSVSPSERSKRVAHTQALSVERPLSPKNANDLALMEQWISISYSYFKPVQMTIQKEMVSTLNSTASSFITFTIQDPCASARD